MKITSVCPAAIVDTEHSSIGASVRGASHLLEEEDEDDDDGEVEEEEEASAD